MATPDKGKAMSSRLLTMKFMQRSAASPTTPTGNESGRPSKKVRLSNGSAVPSAPSTPDAVAVQEALAAEEKRRAEALEREGAARGETKWYLSFQSPQVPAKSTPLRIVSAGYSSLDANAADDSDEADNTNHVHGRRSFGKFNRKLEKQQNPETKNEDSSEEEESSSESEGEQEDPIGVNKLVSDAQREAAARAKEERKAYKKQRNAESQRLADSRRKKEVNLNRVKSISSGSVKRCDSCQQLGHVKRYCPQQSNSQSSGRYR